MIKAITVRNIPLDLARKLRKLADDRHMSLGRLVVALLEEATGLSKKPRSGASNLEKYIGGWTDEEAREFDEAVAEQRRVDPEMWK